MIKQHRWEHHQEKLIGRNFYNWDLQTIDKTNLSNLNENVINLATLYYIISNIGFMSNERKINENMTRWRYVYDTRNRPIYFKLKLKSS